MNDDFRVFRVRPDYLMLRNIIRILNSFERPWETVLQFLGSFNHFYLFEIHSEWSRLGLGLDMDTYQRIVEKMIRKEIITRFCFGAL